MARAGQSQNGQTPAERETLRVVLRRERVIVIPADADQAALATALKEAKLPSWLKPTVVEAWVPVGEFTAPSKAKAIEAYAGKPGTPDAKPGVYRAPTAGAWKGAAEYVKPPVPLIERRMLE